MESELQRLKREATEAIEAIRESQDLTAEDICLVLTDVRDKLDEMISELAKEIASEEVKECQ